MAVDGGAGRWWQLSGLLTRAVDVSEAAEVVVEHLAAHGIPLPSVYLEQGGRLRCLAQRGYWQVLDGIPCDVGVIGRTFRSGETIEIVDASLEEEFLFAAPDLRSQVSVPLRHARRVVGTLNAESSGTLPPTTRVLLEAAAADFTIRLGQLGGPPVESSAQQVARLTTAITQLTSEPEIRDAVIDAALQITGLTTAAIVEPSTAEQARIVVAAGPLSGALGGVAADDLSQLDAWVAAGSSLIASGTAASKLDMHGRLQTAGVAAMAIVPLTASGEQLGSLVVASGAPTTLNAPVISALETLGAQAGASMLTARTITRLRQRARQDALTGLGHHATFHDELRSQLAEPAADRQLAVLMIDIDDFKAVNDRHGHQAGDRMLKQLAARLSGVLRGPDRLYRIGGDEFATIIHILEARDAYDIAQRLVDAARQGPVTISVGVAVAHRDEDARQLIDRADAAMYSSKSANRDAAATP